MMVCLLAEGERGASRCFPNPLAVDISVALRARAHPDPALAAECEADHFWREVAATRAGRMGFFPPAKSSRAEDTAASEADKVETRGDAAADWLGSQGAEARDIEPSFEWKSTPQLRGWRDLLGAVQGRAQDVAMLP
eukprot:4646364-Pyramimonas_sp.AAC.1